MTKGSDLLLANSAGVLRIGVIVNTSYFGLVQSDEYWISLRPLSL